MLVVGVDGLDLRVVEQLGAQRLPHLFSVMEQGAYAALESVCPPATLPNWTTFLTGVDPAQHGVFDFTTRHGYRIRFTGGMAREVPTVFRRLDRLGMRCACLSFPATWPPERLDNGLFVSGWDAPVAFKADRSFMWPPSLYEDTVARFGTPTFDDVDEFHADQPGWIDRLPEALVRRVERKTEWARWLLQRHRFDVFAIYFGESDTAAHYLWAHHDPNSPRRPPAVSALQQSGLGRVYEALDRAVGSLLQETGADTDVTILSDHGSGGSSDKVLHLNRLLADHELLHFKPRRFDLGSHAKEIALRRFPPRLRERVFRLGNAWLPSRLESNVRFGGIDMPRTLAFSDELNYFPGVHLNLAGREPQGTWPQSRRTEALLRVRAALMETRDPWTGEPVFDDVVPREERFDGPFLERAPDLLLDLRLEDGYSYNVMPTGSAETGFRRLSPSEYLGKKGRSLPGSHRPHGFMAMAGPTVRATGRVEARIADVTATLLRRLNLRVPIELRGRVLWEALREDASVGASLPLPAVAAPDPNPGHDQSLVESRLRALGYVE